MTTLYVTDLDGTLLRSDKTISDYTAATLNARIDQGLLFSVASARGPIGLRMLPLGALRFRLPLVLLNGALLYDAAEGTIVQACSWSEATAQAVIACCCAAGKPPILYHVRDRRQYVAYRETTSPGEQRFLHDRLPRFPDEFEQVEAYPVQHAIYISVQDREERLRPLYEQLTALPGVAAVLYKDNYAPDNWYLEAFSDQAGKAGGVGRLRALTGAQRVVAFGDNLNDLPLFAAADVACAVSNALPAVREAADVIIGSNDEDGVARYLEAAGEG